MLHFSKKMLDFSVKYRHFLKELAAKWHIPCAQMAHRFWPSRVITCMIILELKIIRTGAAGFLVIGA